MKKEVKIYEEKYRTLVLFTRFDSFALAADLNNKKDLELDDKICNIMSKNGLLNQKNSGFLCSRIGTKKDKYFNIIFFIYYLLCGG